MNNKLHEIILSTKEINNENLDISNWKTFTIEELFLVKGSKTTPKNILQSYEKGIYPYVTTKATNNGVDDFFNFYTENGNCLTIDSAVLGTCFYQELNFSASDHVELAIPYFKDFNKYHGLFFQIIINKTNQNIYNYSHKYNQKRIKETVLLLPSKVDTNNKNIPDWNYIEHYIKNITLKLKTNNINNIFNNLDTLQLNNKDTSSWKLFKISDYFNVVLSKGDNQIKNLPKGNIPLVSATSENNGIVGFIKNGDSKSQLFNGNSITVDMFGKSFYQKDDFYSVSHGRINILIPLFKMNKSIGMFIITCLKYLNTKYSYSEMCTSKKLENEEFLLPALDNQDGTFSPDWDFMENYINNIENIIFN